MTITAKTTRTLSISLRDDGILHGVALPDFKQTLEDARENIKCALELSGGERFPLLLDIRNTGELSKEARMYYAGEEGSNSVNAVAIVADSAFTRVVGNLFIRLTTTNYPARLFGTEHQAIEWLHGFK